MTINGVNILAQKTIFAPTVYGIIGWVLMMAAGFFFAIMFFDGSEMWAGIPMIVCFGFFIAFVIITFNTEAKTFLNQPSKIQYTIEITNDDAWKELGPNYTIKEKVYENKEIYIVEGDYVK